MSELAGAGGFSAIQTQLKDLKNRADEVKTLLEQQQELLRRRGISLPANAIDRLWSVRSSIDKLSLGLVETQMQLQQLRRLADTTALVNSAQETDLVLNEVMETVIQLTQAERGYIVLKNRETGELEFKVARGLSAEETAAGGRIVSWSVINMVAESGEPLLTVDAGADEQFSHSESIAGFSLLSILAVPLIARDEVIGVAYCDNRIMAGLFKENELGLLTSFGQQAAVAIENARLFEDIRAQMALIEEMHARLSNIFASIGSGVITVNGENCVLVCNEAAEAITGTTNAKACGMQLSAVLPHVTESFYDSVERVRREQMQHIWAERFEHQGRQRYWQVVASPLRGDEQVNHGVALVIDDLTERKEQEEQRRLLGTFVPEALLENIGSISELDTGPAEGTISAMFVDVRGFTAFSETLQPEDLMRVVNRYLGAASDAINEHDGIVDQYLGDAITAFWNSQLNQQDDHAARAVRAAEAILDEVRALHEVVDKDHELHFGIGIHTGHSVMGMVGGADRIEFAALGEAPDVGRFLQENAEPGEIVISPTTYELVRDQIQAEALPARKMKAGFEDLSTIYRVIPRNGLDSGA
ncbi:MAG: GAF domain-containing protein [Chloroflexota bacterium]|nr:GAF domain-containing protein [Chloroflexota bacterium]MDE2945663.1 GAF domain-containing protein [Chloroflexota bacterium]